MADQNLSSLLENYLAEATDGLLVDMYYNSGIGTYLWSVSNRKPAVCKGERQPIDASACLQTLRQSLGSKRSLQRIGGPRQ